MRITARAEYALRACVELARAEDLTSTSEAMAEAQGIPQSFLQRILGDMRQAGYVGSHSRRGGGYWLAFPPDQITVADVVRAMDGPLIRVHGMDPDDLLYPESTQDIATLWVAVRANVRAVLEHVTLQDLATGRLPAQVTELAALSTSSRAQPHSPVGRSAVHGRAHADGGTPGGGGGRRPGHARPAAHSLSD